MSSSISLAASAFSLAASALALAASAPSLAAIAFSLVASAWLCIIAICKFDSLCCSVLSAPCFRYSHQSKARISTSAIPSNQIAMDSYLWSQVENVSHIPDRECQSRHSSSCPYVAPAFSCPGQRSSILLKQPRGLVNRSPLVVLYQAIWRFYFQHRLEFSRQQYRGSYKSCVLPFFSHGN